MTIRRGPESGPAREPEGRARTGRPSRETGRGDGTGRTLAAIALLALGLAACDGGGEDGDGGIIGTGIQLRGTVPTERTLARAEVEIRSSDGELVAAAIGADGRFSAGLGSSGGPWRLRVDLGNGDAYHAIAYPAGASDIVQNVHAYTDLALRNWFAARGRSIDAAYAGDGSGGGPSGDPGAAGGAPDAPTLPDARELAAIGTRIDALLASSLDAYGLAGTDLDTAPFAANDAGVDRFLDRNPVRIADDRVTVLVTDPVNATQARAVDALALATDLVAADVTSPNAPTALRVLPSTRDEIVLAWEGATDDIGIAAYEVVRDGVTIGTTPYPVFLDSPLQPDVPYTYAIVALDASGNRSAPSAPGAASTLAAPDTVAPPPPVNLRLVPGLDAVSLAWGQSAIGDVVSFSIERGGDPERLAPRARVTSTFAIDAGLNSGTTYCYRVRASDASDNASAPTPTLCTTTLGDGVTTVAGSANGDVVAGPVAALDAVDVTALPCTETVPTLRVANAVTIRGRCLRVPSTLSVEDGGALTIAPGTVLKFERGAGLRVGRGGYLDASGTAAAPIVLSGTGATPGAWNGVTFTLSDEARNRLSHVVVEYAGGGGGAALRSDARDALPVRLAADALLLRHGAGPGFAFARNTRLTRFSRVRSTDNASAGTLAPTAAAALGPDSRFGGNAKDGIRLLAETLDEPIAWRRIDVPWLVERLTLDASLAVPPGTRLHFDADAALRVRQDGSFNAVGTAREPIVLRGERAEPGYWTGLVYTLSGSTNNRLEHVTVEHAGAAGTADGAAIVTDARTTLPTRLALANVTLRGNTGAGFRFAENTRLGAFENVSSTANDLSGTLFPGTLADLGAGNAFAGNLRDELELSRQSLEVALTIPDAGVPYRLGGILRTDAPLVLEPGVRMRMRPDSELRIERRGSLTAVGTAAEPIVIEGDEASPGHWNGIVFVYSASEANRIAFATVSHGGGGGTASTARGNVRLACREGLPTRLVVTDSRLTDSAAWGIHRDDPPRCALDVGADVRFERNALGALGPADR